MAMQYHYAMVIEGREYDHQIEKNVIRKKQGMRRSSSKVRERAYALIGVKHGRLNDYRLFSMYAITAMITMNTITRNMKKTKDMPMKSSNCSRMEVSVAPSPESPISLSVI